MSRLAYRPNVCMLVYNRRYQLWIGERYGASTWQFPQGGVDQGSTPQDTVTRELCEELGVEPAHLGSILLLEATHRYDFLRTPARWANKWRGQEQTFWAVQFLGKDSDVDVKRHHPPEFNRWQWCSAEAVLEKVEPIRRPGYEQPVREFLERIVGAAGVGERQKPPGP